MFKLALDGKLFLAPVEGESLRVLDIGTGTGIWAMELGMKFFVSTVSPANRLHAADMMPSIETVCFIP